MNDTTNIENINKIGYDVQLLSPVGLEKLSKLLADNKRIRKVLFENLFPGATPEDFEALKKRKKIRDELSFMEKLEDLIIQEAGRTRYEGDGTENDFEIKFNKLVRQELDVILQAIKGSQRMSRERSLVRTKIEEAVMWMGMDLKAMGSENPYPNSKNPSNAKIDPTADGLKL